MNNGNTLIVPMQVQALCVGNEGSASFALMPMADFSGLPYVSNGVQYNRKPYINTSVLAEARPFEGETTLPAGVHLHWAMPAGLTHGQQQENGTMKYPTVPNRWMVTRIVLKNKTTQSASTITRSWVVESDRLSTTPNAARGIIQPTVPTDPNVQGQNYRYIGQVFDATSWSENPQAERFPNLTALGYGDAAFSSYYPNCSTVFGFYDDMSDQYSFNADYDSLAYLISGWYSDPSQDVASGGIVSEENPYGWVFDNPSQATVNNTVCSGLIENIPWNSGRTYLNDGNDPVSVSIGPSVQEALSALMAQLGGSNADQSETILNALQFGLLSDLDTLTGNIRDFEERVHAAGFSSFNAGKIWQVRRKQGSGTDTNDEEEVTLAEPIAQDLNTLNMQQQQLDKMKEVFTGRRGELFADWYKYLMVEYDTKYTPAYVRERAQAIRDYLRDQVAELNELSGLLAESNTLQQAINSLSGFIAGMLPDEFELTNDVAAPRYWQANNPYFILQGDDVIPVERTGDSATLTCRLSDTLVGSTIIFANAIQQGQPQMSQGYAGSTFSIGDQTLSTLLSSLQSDAVLTSTYLQPVIAKGFYTTASAQHVSLVFLDIVSLLQTSAQSFIDNEAHPQTDYRTSVSAAALPPDQLALFAYVNTPWLPVMLQYDLEFQPVQYIAPGDAYDPDFITRKFSWTEDNDIDLSYQLGSITSPVESYTGAVLLSADAQVNLAESMWQYIQQTPGMDNDEKESLLTIYNAVVDMPLLAQEFSGLMQAMLMRAQTLQMKVADPLANSLDRTAVNYVALAVGEESKYSPEPNYPFNPIRSGLISVQRLRVVDVFGRFKDKTLSSPAFVAKSILPPPTLAAPAPVGTAFLPPRITQPSRLLFRWLSADNDSMESNSHPASSPIIGWVLPDYADNSLLVYNADGMPLGELALSSNNTQSLWFTAPGGIFPISADIQTVMQDQLPWLRNFVMGVYNNGNPVILRTMMDSFRRTGQQSLPAGSSNNAMGILMGQPLAIVRAALRLDLAGDPASDESWESFAKNLVGNERDSAAFEYVKFPVQLGLHDTMNDGLYGYWVEEDSRVDFSGFRDSASSGYGLTLTAARTAASDKTVLMVVDPKGEVHATTGILPVKSIAVPSDQYDAALNSLQVTFLTAPVLSGANTSEISIPLPKTDAGSWSWVTVANNEWQSQNISGSVQNSTQGALDYTPQQLIEGWLRLRDFEN